MVLQLVSGPMLEKSNRTGRLANRQRVLLTARLRVSFFSNFQFPKKREIFKKVLGKFWKSFAGNFFELDYFDIFF